MECSNVKGFTAFLTGELSVGNITNVTTVFAFQKQDLSGFFLKNNFFSRHLCDNIWHCPNGQDEHCNSSAKCHGLFRCVLLVTKVCLHSKEVCDGVTDCASEEDEFLCDVQCHQKCKCLMYAISCAHTTATNVTWFQLSNKRVFINFKNVSLLSMLGRKLLLHPTF